MFFSSKRRLDIPVSFKFGPVVGAGSLHLILKRTARIHAFWGWGVEIFSEMSLVKIRVKVLRCLFAYLLNLTGYCAYSICLTGSGSLTFLTQ